MKQFFAPVENQSQTNIKVMQSDNGPEFIMPEIYASKGIIQQRSYVETHQ